MSLGAAFVSAALVVLAAWAWFRAARADGQSGVRGALVFVGLYSLSIALYTLGPRGIISEFDIAFWASIALIVPLVLFFKSSLNSFKSIVDNALPGVLDEFGVEGVDTRLTFAQARKAFILSRSPRVLEQPSLEAIARDVTDMIRVYFALMVLSVSMGVAIVLS